MWRMMREKLLFIKLVIIFIGRSSPESHCDRRSTAMVEEGNLGQTPDFNWLGVLRVRIHDGDNVHIAVSGIVLIKYKYALANADDVARVPQNIFETDTEVMFIAERGSPWFVRPKAYVTHPEYKLATFNTIAVIELDIEEGYPLNPICLPEEALSAANNLYLIGYTDDNQVLEKVIYEIQYLENQACEEFNHKAGLSDKNREPTSYFCGNTPSDITQCIWENGMVLVSNATGWFTLVGFGIRGPGCAAPARFIDLSSYFGWINSITSTQNIQTKITNSRTGEDDIEFIPAHEILFGQKTLSGKQLGLPARRANPIREYIKYPFGYEQLSHFTIEPLSDHTFAVFEFDEMWELPKNSCKTYKTLLYREVFKLNAPPDQYATTTYKLSMYDLSTEFGARCVKLKVDADKREKAVLSFKETINFNLGTQLTASADTPEELFRYFPLKPKWADLRDETKPWKPHENLKIQTLNLKTRYLKNTLNYDLYIKFEFTESAILAFELYGLLDLYQLSTEASAEEVPTSPRTRKKKPNKHWGMTQPVDKRVKEPEVTLVAEHKVVHKTVSQGCHNEPAIILITLGHFILLFCINYRAVLP